MTLTEKIEQVKARLFCVIEVKFDDIRVFEEGDDYLTVKLQENFNLRGFLEDMTHGSEIELGFADLKLKYNGLTAGSQLKVYTIHNGAWTGDKKNKQQIACVHIKQDTGKTNTNMNTNIEFVGKFWNFYKQFDNEFYNLFNIDTKQNNIITRIDYRFDLTNITVKQVYDLCKVDTGELSQKKFNRHDTWFKLENDRHVIAVYDKKYDILDGKKMKYKERIKGKQIYKHIIDYPGTITRIEYRKHARAFADFENNSIEETRRQVRNMAINHIKKWFYLDIKKIVDKYIILDRYKKKVKDSFNIGFAEKKAKLALDRGLSYLRSYADLKSDKELFRHLDMILGPRLKNHFLKDFMDNEEIRAEAKKIFS